MLLRPFAGLLLVLSLSFAALVAGYLDPVDHSLTEWRFGQAVRPPTGEIVLVDIDAKSLAAIGDWPWSRSVHARLLTELDRLDAAEIAFDIDFSARSSPQGDLDFESAIRSARAPIVLAAFNQSLHGGPESSQIHANLPLERFARHAWIASVNVRPDPDGLIRRSSLGERIAGAAVPSLPATLGGYSGRAEGDFLIDFGINAVAIDRISAIDLLNGTVEPARIAKRKALIGAAAVELRDIFQIPAFGFVSGATVEALAAETVLQGRMLHRYWAFSLGALLLAGAIGLALPKLSWTTALLVLFGSAVLLETTALVAQQHWNIVPDSAVGLVALLGLAVARILREVGLGRLLAAMSSTEAQNARTILARVVEDNFAGIVAMNEDGTVLAASRAAAGFLECSNLVGRNCRDLLPPELTHAVAAAISDYRIGAWRERLPAELDYRRPGGEGRTLEYVITPSRLSGGLGKLGQALPDQVIATLTFQDITERKAAAARLQHLACYDGLTGLPNRNLFQERLATALAQRFDQPPLVIFLDLDRFKNVNDTLGHHFGDLLLRAVAQRLEAVLGPRDLAARFGGDEYAVIRYGDAAFASQFAEQLIRNVGEPYEIDGHRVIIGVSLGMAVIGAQDTDPAEIMKNADAALYKAKADRGNAYRVYDVTIAEDLKSRQSLELQLWDAFQSGQFEVHYQPQFNLQTEEIIGAEALLRWRHPTRGFVPPAEFIPVAEAVGLIEPIGAWLMREACLAAAEWPRPVKVGVNISPVQFTRGDLRATVSSALAASGLATGRLDLEITESLLVNESATIGETILALRHAGVSFSIDDFGTGYSSLSYIRRFPVQTLKIDQSFVRGLPSDRESTGIVRAICALAQSLELGLIAEGIETAEQAIFLRLLGCREGQGYLFSRPVTAAEVGRMLLPTQGSGAHAARNADGAGGRGTVPPTSTPVRATG
jgi:diguanylate cyclase (GGDEF)-like protein/PAS domain S-box-containing protein